MFARTSSTICSPPLSHLFEHPEFLELGWNAADYGLYASGYSVSAYSAGWWSPVCCWTGGADHRIHLCRDDGAAALVAWAITSGLAPKTSLSIAYVGCMFSAGSEIAGWLSPVHRQVVQRRNMAFAMGLQLAIARLGTAFALVISPKLVATKAAGEVYTLSETARPAFLGLSLMLAGIVLWAIFVSMDARFDKAAGLKDRTDKAKADQFRFSDVLKLLKNKQFILIALLCVFFYSSVISFKKFASAILIPRFDVPVETASWMVSMLPFATVIFAPLFGIMVDRIGKGTRWMIVGSVGADGHLLLAFGPPECLLRLSQYDISRLWLLPCAAALCFVPKIVPDKVLGTAFRSSIGCRISA